MRLRVKKITQHYSFFPTEIENFRSEAISLPLIYSTSISLSPLNTLSLKKKDPQITKVTNYL